MNHLRFETIGCARPHGEPQAACSCYLLRPGSDILRSIMVDCGHGAVAALLARTDVRTIAAVLITHLHPDHWMDLFAFRNALMAHRVPADTVRLLLPPGGGDRLARICETLDIGSDYFARSFALSEYEPGADFEVETLTVRAFRTRHPVPTFGLRLGDVGSGAAVTITSDTAAFAALADLVSDTRLLVIECDEAARAEASEAHLSIGTLIDTLRAARNLGRVVVTHYPFAEAETIGSRLRAALPGLDVVLATPGAVFDA